MPGGKCDTSWVKTSNKKPPCPGLCCNQIQTCCVCSVPTAVSVWERLLNPLRIANSQASSLPLSKEKLTTAVYGTWATGQSWANVQKSTGKETWPTSEMEQAATHRSQSDVIMWDSLGCIRVMNFNEKSGIKFIVDSKNFVTRLQWLNAVDTWLRHLWATQLHPLLLHGAALCPLTLPSPH